VVFVQKLCLVKNANRKLPCRLGIMSVKTNTALKAKPASMFPKSLSFLPGTASPTATKGSVVSSKEDSVQRKRPCSSQPEISHKKSRSPSSHKISSSSSQPEPPVDSGNKILGELNHLAPSSVSVAEKIQQFNQRQKDTSQANERDASSTSKKKRVEQVDLVTPVKQAPAPKTTCSTPKSTFEEIMSL